MFRLPNSHYLIEGVFSSEKLFDGKTYPKSILSDHLALLGNLKLKTVRWSRGIKLDLATTRKSNLDAIIKFGLVGGKNPPDLRFRIKHI